MKSSIGWKTYKLEEIAEIVGGGTPSTTNPEFWGEEIPWITPRDLADIDEQFIARGERCITNKGLQNSSARLLPTGSVLLTTRAPIGYLRIALNPVCTNQGFKSLIPNTDIIDNRFLFYLLKNNVEYLKSIGVGTTFAEISGSTLRQIEFQFPPLGIQRRIAEVLGSLDAKIELNRRMNRTLEAIAQAVFREWFVNSEEVQGWEVRKLGEVANNLRHGIRPQQIEPTTNYIGLEHMPRASIALTEWGYASELASNKFVFRQGDFLFGKLRPYFHKVGIAPINGICSTDILVIVPRAPEWYGFVLEHISSVELINYTNAASTGTKMPRTSWSDIASYEVSMPPVELAEEFNQFFMPIVKQIQVNIMQSHTLAHLRDTLLPKLMRGEVRAN